jgi:hypothetical protein
VETVQALAQAVAEGYTVANLRQGLLNYSSVYETGQSKEIM